MTKLTAEQRIQKAVIRVMREEPFFATILLKMEIKATPTPALFPTIGTNGDWLVYNPTFVQAQNDGELSVILKHEAEHIAFGHHIRMAEQMKLMDLGPAKAFAPGAERIHALSNVATDLAINSMLMHEKNFPKIEGTCAPGLPGFEDMPEGENAEWYYAKLKKKAEEEQQEGSGQSGGPGCNAGQAGGARQDDNDSSGGTAPGGEDNGSDDAEGGEERERLQRRDGNGGDDIQPEAGSGTNDGGSGDSRGQQPGSDGGQAGSDNEDDAGSGEQRGNQRGPGVGDADGEDMESRGPAEGGSPAQSTPENSGESSSRSKREAVIQRTRNNPMGSVEPATMGNNKTLDEIESEWQRTVAIAMAEAKSAGEMPGHIEEALRGLFGVNQVPWRQALRPFLTEVGCTGYSYKRPNRRRGYGRVILPDPHDSTIKEVVFVVDTSGSMSPEEMELVFPELENIIRTYQECTVRIIMHDSEIAWDKNFTLADLPLKADKLAFRGRGGTRFGAVTEYLKDKNVGLVVWLTDMQPCDDFPARTPYPIVWLATTDRKAPWGFTIRMEIDK